ncbi:acyltransferase [Corynebacterium mucifaciens]|uniref:Acyltransferase n=1 Tax=Corynebacterium mucifaciens TaxID=57171 RepID=A0A7X6LT31_9CORY|nr:acyltransferase [Corynebacterium mucifaciens]
MRAVAAYGIVATHVAFQTATGSAVLERFDYFVAVFFALSAFLLSRGGLRGGYYSRRVARLAPAYVVCVAVVLLALPPLAGVTWGQAAANLLLVQVYVPHSLIDGLTQMWSLCIEAAFYVVLPLYLRLDGRGRRAALAGSVVLGLAWPWAVSGISDPAVLNMQIWPPSYAPWFAVGLLLAELERAGVRYAGPRWPFPVLALPVAWVAGVIGPRGLEHPSPAEFNVRVLLGAVFAALVVAPYALGQRFVGTVLSSPVMRTLGRWSYSVFLWHMAVLYFVFPVLGVQVFSGRFMLVFAATALASTAVAYMSYELVEVPGGRLVRQATAKQPATMRKVEEPA